MPLPRRGHDRQGTRRVACGTLASTTARTRAQNGGACARIWARARARTAYGKAVALFIELAMAPVRAGPTPRATSATSRRSAARLRTRASAYARTAGSSASRRPRRSVRRTAGRRPAGEALGARRSPRGAGCLPCGTSGRGLLSRRARSDQEPGRENPRLHGDDGR